MQTEEEKIGVLQKALSRSVNVAIAKLTAPSVLPLTLSKKVWNGYWEMQSAQDNLEKKLHLMRIGEKFLLTLQEAEFI